MLTDELLLVLEEIIEKIDYRGGGSIVSYDPSGKMVTKKKPMVWMKKPAIHPQKDITKAAASAARSKLVKSHLARAVAKQKKAEVIPFPKRAVAAEPMRKVMTAGLDLSQALEYILNDQYDLSGEEQARKSLRRAGLNPGRERRLAKAKHKQLKAMKGWEAEQKRKREK